jgi:hypothetical protein
VHDRLDLSTPTGRRRHRQLLATVSSAPSEAGAGGRCSPPRPRSRPRSRPRAR